MFVQPSTSSFPSQPLHSLAALATVRVAFVEWLRSFGVDQEQVEDLSVVISELGANAVRETPEGERPAEVDAQLQGTTLELHVSNAVGPGTTAAHDHDWDLDDALRTGGRGLLLVSAIGDDVTVAVDDGRLLVRCTSTIRRQVA